MTAGGMTAGVRRLVLVWAGLLALLAATLGAAFLPLGAIKPWIGYAIAAGKAALVLWFFMGMRGEGGLARLASVVAFAWLAIMLTLASADYLTRDWPAREWPIGERTASDSPSDSGGP